MGKRFPVERRVTIGDVAELAGVSKATVSKVLGGGDYYVSQDARQRIAAAVDELDFQPNAIARDLVRRRTQTVGMVVASIANPVYPELMAGVDEVLGRNDFTVLFGSTEGRPERESDVVRSMRQRQVDGVVLASVTMDHDEVEKLVGSGLDVVLASRHLHRADLVDAVVVDNVAGGRIATEHLLDHGHERVAHIAGPQNVMPFAERRHAWWDTMVERQGQPDADLEVRVTESTVDAGADAAARLLDLGTPPTAVFVSSDRLAVGVLEECSRRGVAVPGGLAVVAFDNIWVGRMPGVRLTTVDSRAREVGRLAAERLVQRITDRWEGRPATAPSLTTLPARLMARATCGCADDRPPPTGYDPAH